MAILFARMAPFMSYLVPWFIMFRKLELIDSYAGSSRATWSSRCRSWSG